MKSRDLMTSDPRVVTPSEPVSRAAEIMRHLNVGIVPVVDNLLSMRLEGLITDRDIAVRCVSENQSLSSPVSDFMTKEHLDTVHEDDDVEQVTSLMEHDRVRRIPVVSDDGRVVGMISQADLAIRLGRTDPLKVEEVLARVSSPLG